MTDDTSALQPSSTLTGATDGTTSEDPVSARLGAGAGSSGGGAAEEVGTNRRASTASSAGSPFGGADGGSGASGASGDGSSRSSSRSSWRSSSRSGDGASAGTGLSRALPSITTMIRMDHTHVLANFHRFRPNLSTVRQQAIADAICLALEVHAQLEEEIFYPALQEVAAGESVLQDARPEHDQMRRLIAELRGCDPGEPRFRETLDALMREVMHHVADEETVLIPLAEQRLADRLGELGAEMTKRRLQLVAPNALQMAKNQALAMPVATLAAVGALAGGAWLLASSMRAGRR